MRGFKTRSHARPLSPVDLAARIRFGVVVVLQLIMLAELALLLYDRRWVTAFLVLAIMVVSLLPYALSRHFRVHVPAEFQMLAVIFVFATLFLGEIRSYYERIWWWDMALHASSGLLLAIAGFLLVYVLNGNARIDLHLRPRFVALFAFMFAVTVGVLWEIFEFAMDQLFGMQMQKPMLGDPSGLTDTMWDLIVDALGALVISVLGWRYMERGQPSFMEAWIRTFIERNPRLFRGRGRPER